MPLEKLKHSGMMSLEEMLASSEVQRMVEQVRQIRREPLSFTEIWAIALLAEAQGKVNKQEVWK